MKKLVMLAVATTMSLLGAPAAHADHVVGECEMRAISIVAAPFDGVITGTFTHSGGGNVDVTCWLQVNGVPQPGTYLRIEGTASASNVRDIHYVANEGDIVEICEDVAGHGGPECFEVSTTVLPPQVVYDVVNDLLAVSDLMVCELLAALAPGVPGVLDIDSTGDIHLAGEFIWDCPPYETGPGILGRPIRIQEG